LVGKREGKTTSKNELSSRVLVHPRKEGMYRPYPVVWLYLSAAEDHT